LSNKKKLLNLFLVCTWHHRRHVGVHLTKDFSLTSIVRYTNMATISLSFYSLRNEWKPRINLALHVDHVWQRMPQWCGFEVFDYNNRLLNTLWLMDVFMPISLLKDEISFHWQQFHLFKLVSSNVAHRFLNFTGLVYFERKLNVFEV
jgi:hypothetical protein